MRVLRRFESTLYTLHTSAYILRVDHGCVLEALAMHEEPVLESKLTHEFLLLRELFVALGR